MTVQYLWDSIKRDSQLLFPEIANEVSTVTDVKKSSFSYSQRQPYNEKSLRGNFNILLKYSS